MENATPQKGAAIASQVTQAQPARTSAQTFAVAKANAPLEDACALQALSGSTARSKLAAVDMEIARSQELASATPVGWVPSVPLLCNVRTRVVVAMELVRMETVGAQLASLA